MGSFLRMRERGVETKAETKKRINSGGKNDYIKNRERKGLGK